MERAWDVWWWHRSKCSRPKASQSSWLCKADLNWMWGRTLHGPLSNSTLDSAHLKSYHHGCGWTSLDCVAQKHYKRIAHYEHNSLKLQKFFLRLKGTNMHIKLYWFKNGFMGPFHRNLASYPQIEWQTFCLDAIPLKKEWLLLVLLRSLWGRNGLLNHLSCVYKFSLRKWSEKVEAYGPFWSFITTSLCHDEFVLHLPTSTGFVTISENTVCITEKCQWT